MESTIPRDYDCGSDNPSVNHSPATSSNSSSANLKFSTFQKHDEKCEVCAWETGEESRRSNKAGYRSCWEHLAAPENEPRFHGVPFFLAQKGTSCGSSLLR
ncbi:uncharacterized protein LOC111374048 [Olea europaea var. sylvestris]|uniref:uncharacterized protein LOC111374048 n=1 Tax=Olea europaea var. sylvestris TaxID=158386 RepID=UPI000C1CF643|nr:uncharacterized protein LOC111374048 [Olea europaea var. sylvestris]